ncbi:MAG: L,D-transpeptidase family protein [Chromatiales bacterium]|nr:L,D-transpeptidase family protein [Chromatiales bacterium]
MVYPLKIILLLSSFVGSVWAANFSYNQDHIIVGSLRIVTAQADDTFVSLGQQYSLGYDEMIIANPDIDAWVPKEGSEIILPGQFILPSSDYRGIYINLAEMRIYYYPEGSTQTSVYTYPISIGRGDWLTPKANAEVIDKIVEPTWYPPESVREEHALAGEILPRSVPPGADNPLGKYALQLNLPGYFIHGTNRPEGVGMKVTHGCIRLRPADIEILFNMTPRQTPVTIQYLPFKVAVEEGVAYLEAHEGDDPQVLGSYLGAAIIELSRLLADKEIPVDWEKFIRVAKESRGFPVPVNLGSYPLVMHRQERLKTQREKRDYIF